MQVRSCNNSKKGCIRVFAWSMDVSKCLHLKLQLTSKNMQQINECPSMWQTVCSFKLSQNLSHCWPTAVRNTSASCNAVFCELENCSNQLKSRSCLMCSLCTDKKKLSAVPAEVYKSILKYLQPYWAAFLSIWSQRTFSKTTDFVGLFISSFSWISVERFFLTSVGAGSMIISLKS